MSGFPLLFGGGGQPLGLSTQVGQFAAATSTGNQIVNFASTNMTPGLVLLWGNTRTTNGVGGTTLAYTVGAATSSTNRFCMNVSSDNAVNPSNTSRGNSDVLIARLADGTPTLESSADFVSANAGGFTINWTDAPGSAWLMNYLALGGTDLTNAKVGSFAAATGTGNQAVTGVGFQPDMVLFFMSPSASVNLVAIHQLVVGCAVSSSKQWAFGMSDRDAQTPTAIGVDHRTDRCLTLLQSALTIDGEATFVSQNADGFTINWVDAPAAASLVYYVALKGPLVDCGTFASPTSPGDTVTSGMAFRPNAIWLGRNGRLATGISTTVNYLTSFGAVSAQTDATFAHASCSNFSIDNSAASAVFDGSSSTQMMNAVIAAGAQGAQATLTSRQPTGFTLTWANSATANLNTWWAVGPVAVEEGTNPASSDSGGTPAAALPYYYYSGE